MLRSCAANRTSVTVAAISVAAMLLPVQAGEVSRSYKTESAQRLRGPQVAQEPQVLHTAHSRGNIQLAVANNGTFGTYGEPISDPFTGEMIPSCEYPRNSDITYLWVAAFWIGAVVGRDTLVSCASEDFYTTTEFWPELP
ncbi:MAG: hypothetical protein ACYS21_21150, partial [Planctomycetota bacterium]